MTTLVTLKVGSATSGRDYATIAAAWAAIPANLVTADVSYVIELYNDSEFIQNSQISLPNKITDASHTITIRPAAGQGYANNPNSLTNALRYNPANGVAFRGTLNGVVMFNAVNAYLTIEGLQIDCGGTGVCGAFGVGNANATVQNNLIEYSGTDARTDPTVITSFANQVATGTFRNNQIVLKSANSHGVRLWSDNSPALCENNTIHRLPGLARGGFGFYSGYGSYYASKVMRNCAVFGADLTMFPQYGTYDHCASDGSFTTNGTGHLKNLLVTDVFVDPTYDLRLKAGSPLIDTGAAPGNTNLSTISGNRQMGTSADIGAWEYPQALAAPTGKITKITVAGNQVTVEGTYTGLIDSARVSLLAAAGVIGNNAVSQIDVPATFGSGIFSAVLTGCKVGKYTVAGFVANAAYNTQTINDVGGCEIVGGRALSVVQDPISGQVYTLHGTCANADSGTLVIPALTANPNGAIAQSLDLTINKLVTPNTFTASVYLGPGNYDAGILTFTNADGTSLPQAGASAVTILGITGYPQSPVTDPVPIATITGVTVSPSTATGAATFAAVVNGDNNPSQGVRWTTTAGTITSAGVFTPPAPTDVIQTVTIKAASLIDSTKFGTATVTIAALVVVIPDPEPQQPTVTGVTLASFSSVLQGGAQYNLTAFVQGTNNPSQAVTWVTTLGNITAGGVLTAPVATSAVQQGSITATSVADPTKSATITFSVAAQVVTNPLPDPQPTTGEGTLVEFHFITPENIPIANSRFEVQLKAADFTNQVDGVMMPRLIEGMTDANGKQILELVSCDTPYYAIMEDPVSEAGLVYLFYVPDVDQPTVVRLQDIVVDSISTTVPVDQAILAQILEAKGQVLAAKAAIDAKFDALAGPNGSTLVGHRTGTVATALDTLASSGGGGGSGGSGVMGEVIIQNTTQAQLDRIDGTLGNLFLVKLDANLTLPPVKNPVPGTTYSFLFQQDISGGRTITLDKKYRFQNNAAPVFSTSPNMISYMDGVYSSIGFFFCHADVGTYTVSGLVRIGLATYETMAAGYTALQDGQTLYVTRDGQMGEVIAALTKPGTYTIAGAPELGSIPKLHMDKTIRAAWGKGLLNIEAGNVTIRDLWFDGAVNDVDETISGVRYNGGVQKLVMQRVKTTNCNNGQLCGVVQPADTAPVGQFNIEHIDCVFDGNGIAYQTAEKGQTHNIYLNHGARYHGLRNQYINAVEGHDFKTRANFVLLDRCHLEGAMNSRELDVPNGGVIHVVNTIIRKKPGTTQGNMIGIGQEGNLQAEQEYIFRNCVLDNSQGGNFSETWVIQAGGGTAVVKFVDCVFIGSAKCVMVTPFELYYTRGGTIGPEGWDQTVRGITPKKGTTDSMAGNTIFPDAQQPQPQTVDVDPTLVAFPATGSTATPSVRTDLDQVPH
jgi:hypothetical protein